MGVIIGCGWSVVGDLASGLRGAADFGFGNVWLFGTSK